MNLEHLPCGASDARHLVAYFESRAGKELQAAQGPDTGVTPDWAFPHKTRSVAAAAAVGFRTLPPKDRKRAEPTEKPATLRLTPGRNAEVGIRTAPNGEVELRNGGCHRFRWCPRRFVLLAHFILLKRSQSQLFRRAEINIYYTKVYGTFFHVVNGSEPPGHKALES